MVNAGLEDARTRAVGPQWAAHIDYRGWSPVRPRAVVRSIPNRCTVAVSDVELYLLVLVQFLEVETAVARLERALYLVLAALLALDRKSVV